MASNRGDMLDFLRRKPSRDEVRSAVEFAVRGFRFHDWAVHEDLVPRSAASA